MSKLSILLSILALPALLVAQKPGTSDQTLEVDGEKRQYVLHVPRGYKKTQKKTIPLVLMLHGRGSNGRAASSRYYGWTPLADKEKFIAVFPTALGKPTSWQRTRNSKSAGDAKFLSQLIDKMLKDFRVDKNKVFMTGHSSGGFMSFSFGTTHSDKVAAIGPVAGILISRDKPKLPVAVISFHGMADEVVAYDSKHGKKSRYGGMPSAMESAATFAKYNQCSKQAKRTELAKGKVHLDVWSKGKANTEVHLYSIEGGDHGWPRGRGPLAATKIIWEFFKEHGRGQTPTKKSRKKRTRK